MEKSRTNHLRIPAEPSQMARAMAVARPRLLLQRHIFCASLQLHLMVDRFATDVLFQGLENN